VISYRGRHAALYDLFYEDKPYSSECSFIHQKIQELSSYPAKKLLELACGTGSHAFIFEKLGYDLVAMDNSEDMLSVARAKASSARSSVKFYRQDMCTIDLKEELFDATICLFDSIGYVQTNEAIGQAFEGVYRHLKEDGLFIFEFWHAAAMLRHYDPLRVRRWKLADKDILRITETKLECQKQLAHVSYDIYEFLKDGTYVNMKEIHINRYFLLQEMEMLLDMNGFTSLRYFSGYANENIINENTWHVVAVARKKRKNKDL